ncbi:MAG TPA: hydantoinase B/oxoprolinase family protein [Steroidobacter sp.]|jgi:acetophenone carboxylase|nr:hydantoinase B/oxoprolinase family protein [Steroidobacteraceae bacterium]HLS83028.1 hydantoinase B/oxoprolinase family protein [Steroidobacter sp.]
MKVDRDILQRYRIEPRTAREEQGVAALGAADFSVYSMKLELIAEEAKAVMVKTAISEAIQSGDCAFGIYTAAGDLAIGAPGTYVHSITGQIPIKYIMKHYVDDPTVGVRPGDIFFANEPQLGGIHAPDLIVMMPVFHEEELVCWVVAAGHNQEIGETDPGGVENIRSRYDEGLKTPPLKIAENDRLKADVMAMFCNMVRNHRMLENDIHARCAACLRARERLQPLYQEKGAAFIDGVMRKALEAAADATRAAFAEMLDGTYRHVMFLDSAGNKQLGLIRLVITLIKQGNTLTVDLNGCSPQAPASAGNTPTHAIRAAINAMLPGYLVPGLPCSSGLFDAVTIVPPPEGTVLNPSPEAAVMGGANMMMIMSAGFVQCLARASYATRREFVSLPVGWIGSLYAYAGLDQYQRTTTGFAISMYNSSGGGARPDKDGVDSMGVQVSMTADSLDVEHDEVQHPFLWGFRRLTQDQAGAGKYRGGAAASCSAYVHDTPVLYANIMATPHSFPLSAGIFGGYAAGCGPAVVVRNGGRAPLSNPEFQPPSSMQEMASAQEGQQVALPLGQTFSFSPMQEGDGFAARGASGGGWGDVLEREPEAVMKDLRIGVCSPWAAKNLYCVAYDPETLLVDEARTKALRDAERRARLARGRPYDEFAAEWEKLSPPQELLSLYGSWPDAKPLGHAGFFA